MATQVCQPRDTTQDGPLEQMLHAIFDDAEDPAHACCLEVRLGKRQALLRATYAEFIGTLLYFLPIIANCANNSTLGFSESFGRITGALVSGMNLVCMIMCFSGLSGAQFNPAVTFALWVSSRITARKAVFFIIAQLAASLTVMCFIWACFPTVNNGLFLACTVTPAPGASSWNVFFTEFVTTFIMTYAAFCMAFEEAQSLKSATMSFKAVQESDGLIMYGSTPQSKVGFAPFAMGFVVFSLCLFGGGSNVAMNPVRIFGPAVFSNEWNSFYYYIIGQLAGAGMAGTMVVQGPHSAEHKASIVCEPAPVVSGGDLVEEARGTVGGTAKSGCGVHRASSSSCCEGGRGAMVVTIE